MACFLDTDAVSEKAGYSSPACHFKFDGCLIISYSNTNVCMPCCLLAALDPHLI